MYEYKVISKWAGWGGGWGSESDIAALANALGDDGWRLVRSEADGFRWFWIMPRRKVLLFFERAMTARAAAAKPSIGEVAAKFERAVDDIGASVAPTAGGPFVRR